MSTLHRIFVYGTLRRGLSNHYLLERATFAGLARTAPGFRLYHLLAYPGMVAVGDGVVHGELFDIDDRTLARVDGLEGHPDFYLRTPISLDDGQVVETYLLRLDQVDGRRVI